MMKRSKNIEARQRKAIEDKSRLLKNIESEETLRISQQTFHSKRLITFDNVAIYYNSKAVCNNISFTIEQGDRIALKGRNGSRKIKYIKLICGESLDYSGNFSKQTITRPYASGYFISERNNRICSGK